MPRPTLETLVEVERSDNFHFDNCYMCVLRYRINTNSEGYYGNLHLVVLSKSGYLGSKWWTPTQQRVFTRLASAKAYYHKKRREMMRMELKEAEAV